MNERIKKLEDQCWVKVPCDFDMNYGGLSTIHTVFDRKKFAQLIVKECISISESHAKNLESQPCDPNFEQYEDGIVNGIYEATAAIKEHFGVEE